MATPDISKQFSALQVRMDQRFEEVGSRLDKQDRKIGETLALVEENQKSIKVLGEGFTSLNTKVDRGFTEMGRRFDAIEATYTPLATHAALDRRVRRLEKTAK